MSDTGGADLQMQWWKENAARIKAWDDAPGDLRDVGGRGDAHCDPGGW